MSSTLLYLPAQILFLIGGEHITCGGSKLTNSLGRTKLSLGQQAPPEGGQNSRTPQGDNNLNFRLARDQVVHLETARNLCTSRPDLKKAIEVGQRFLIEAAFIIQEKGFIFAETYQIKKRETTGNVSCLQA